MNEDQGSVSNTNVGKYSVVLSLLHVFQNIRAILHIILFLASPSKPVIEKDIERWLELTHYDNYKRLPTWKGLIWLLWKYQEYRNLFYYRIKKENRLISRVFLEVAKLFYAPMSTLYIRAMSIDEGLYVQHGYCTEISARSIGKNCWINQQVVIGYSDEGKTPTIGDNVHITAGAKVFGDITIGNNSIIGANAVVFKNIPPNCTVVGVPGYIVKRDGKKVKEPL